MKKLEDPRVHVTNTPLPRFPIPGKLLYHSFCDQPNKEQPRLRKFGHLLDWIPEHRSVTCIQSRQPDW